MKYIIMVVIFVLILAMTILIYFNMDQDRFSERKEQRREQYSQNEDTAPSPTPDNDSGDENDVIYTVVENPSYNILENKKYGVHIEYPDHFVVSNTESENYILNLRDPNNAAILNVIAIPGNSLTPIEVADLIENTLFEDKQLTKLDEYFTDNRLYRKYRLDNTIIQLAGIVSSDSICILEFRYAEFEAHVYDKYFQYIHEHFTPLTSQNEN